MKNNNINVIIPVLRQNTLKNGLAVLAGLSFFKLLLHLYTNAFASYGIFRDELYYIACSNRLALGYVDQPPFSLYLLSLSRKLFGDSLFAIRLFPAIAGALTVFFAGLIVCKLGGRKVAILIAALAVIFAPINLGMNTVYSMNSFDILLWVIAAYLVILITEEGNPKLWIGLGVVLGLGFLNKIGMLWFGFGFFAALLLTTHRKVYKTKWPWVAGVLAFLIFVPFIIWNLTHGLAHIEFIRNATSLKYSSVTRIDFVSGQILLQNPAALPVWLAGLFFYFFHKEGRKFRIIGYIYVIAFLILLINGHSKPEYLAPAYPMLFAAGAVLIEKLSMRKFLRWLRFAVPVIIVMFGLMLAPIGLPILPVETFVKYQGIIGIGPPSAEGKELADLPQHYADMFGWENMAGTVAGVYHSLSEYEQSKTIIFAQNYGEAGAIEYYSEKYDLPRVISGHNNYWIWGYGDDEAETVIIIGGDKEDHLNSCEQVEQAAVIKCDYCMPYENNLPVYICRKIKVQISDIWDSLKHFE